MSTNQTCPATFFVDVCVPGVSHLPMRELVRFSPHSGLSFNAKFAQRYWYLPARAFVARSSSPWLCHFDSVALLDRRVPIR